MTTPLTKDAAEAVAYKLVAEKLIEAITLHHERCKTLGLNFNRDKPQWGGPWDHELWATVGLPSGPLATDSTEAQA